MSSRAARDLLFQCLKMVYLSQNKENLPIYGIAKSKQLTDFCTSQNDVKRGISRIPLILARIYEEDTQIQKISTPNFRVSPHALKNESCESEKLIENLQGTIEHRNLAQRNSRTLSNNLRNSDSQSLDADFNFDSMLKDHSQASASVLWRRDTLINATFDDFELLSIIGHGTFGKVYLVSQKKKKTLHAMKCIRWTS
jgi:hypothetical protein